MRATLGRAVGSAAGWSVTRGPFDDTVGSRCLAPLATTRRPLVSLIRQRPWSSLATVGAPTQRGGKPMTAQRETVQVDHDLFRAVYDSPASLPGRHRWTTPESDVRRLEKLLGMPARSVGAPLWVSGDEPDCPKCRRRITWYDIVSSALSGLHD